MAKSEVNEWLEQDKLTLLEAWARDGLTEKQIATNMGICEKTLYNWKNDNLQILQALKKGKEVVDFEVENALLKRALGYDYEEKTYENGILKKTITKHVSPDTTAQIFWLKNRKPKEWRDKVVYEGEVKTNGVINDLVEALNNVKKNK